MNPLWFMHPLVVAVVLATLFGPSYCTMVQP